MPLSAVPSTVHDGTDEPIVGLRGWKWRSELRGVRPVPLSTVLSTGHDGTDFVADRGPYGIPDRRTHLVVDSGSYGVPDRRAHLVADDGTSLLAVHAG